jgi:AraC-like DNA-binding protein
MMETNHLVQIRSHASTPKAGNALDPIDDSSDLVRHAHGLVACGALREAIRLLERRIGEVENLGPGAAWGVAGLLLALAHALLGFEEDAQEWLGRAHRHALAHRGSEALSWIGAMHVLLAYLAGDDVLAIRLGNQHLLSSPKSTDCAPRAALIAVMGRAYLRLAQLSKAQLCVAALGRLEAGDELALHLRFSLEAELELARMIRDAACSRAHVLYVDDLNRDSVERGASVERAVELFECAAHHAQRWPVLGEIAAIGARRARLLEHGAPAREAHDWQALERFTRFLAEQGLVAAHFEVVLQVGVTHLVRGAPLAARRCLFGPSQRAMEEPCWGFAADALYYGANACASAGDSAGAARRLLTYLERLRSRHLLRAVLPPPQIDPQAAQAPLLAVATRTSDLDDVLVARITALVRDDPSQPLSSDGLAVLFGVSRRTLQYRFRRATGKTPKEFITALRVEHARVLLARQSSLAPEVSRGALERVAGVVGFTTYRAFNRAFRTICAQTPAEYITQVGGAPDAQENAPALKQLSAGASETLP